MWVLGISCYYHDSAPALINDNEITFAIHEERLTVRSKTRDSPLWQSDEHECKTGVPALTNTSFNLRGEPMVSGPCDALDIFPQGPIRWLWTTI